MKYIYLTVLIIILIIVLSVAYNFKYEITLYFSSPDNFRNYRLGDMVYAGDDIRHNVMGKSYHLKHYSNSIASKYLSQTDDYENYNILFEIVKNYDNDKNNNKKIITPDDVLVVHLRVGDVIDYSKYNVDDFLKKELTFIYSNHNYVKPLSYYQKIIEKHKDSMPKKVKLVAGG